ncbi:dicarboxylate/amino acid:cation symporter [Novosphingobium sp. Chol11]|uniref:dicarboxylate/amino acid:cation symporter n=1 Tax=Novosphingobium sp. Chol11 TaxID=1385763 RepID=UPI0020D249F8|nr:cation:dicarboxylase symporter family transporter [Novosphingobium sp. Chol11]
MLAGLVLGLAAGIIISGPLQQTLGTILQPVGSLWLDALTMTVVPLVFGLLVTGIASASRNAASGSIAGRALILFALMLTAASVCAAFLAEGLLRLWPVAQGFAPVGAPPPPPPQSAWYSGIIPANPIKAAAETAMVPLVVFAIFFGFAIARITRDLADALLKLLTGLVETMLVIVGWVLAVAPIGIAALAFGAGAKLGVGAVGAFAQYIAVVAACCLAATLLAYLWAALAGRRSPLRFARSALPAQAVALGTQSSLATLPVMVDAARDLDVPEETAAIVLPMAVSLFRASSVAANVAVAIYLGHMHGVAIGIATLALIALVAVPVSLGAVGLPAQVSFFATIAPVCIAAGVPVTALPLLLAIEAIPDLFRTVGNVTNDIAAACIVTPSQRHSF